MERFDIAVVGMGALGSAATYHLAQRGLRVVAFEQYELGHVRGASHDTSRIVRTSYDALEYVRLAQSSYRDWAELEARTGENLLTITGGVVFCPPESPVPASAYADSLDTAGVPFELLDTDEVHDRWPEINLPPGVQTVYTPDTGIAHAARTVAALQMHARFAGADIRSRTTVERLTPTTGGVVVHTASGDVLVDKVILAADAWTNDLLAPLESTIPLTTMQEQVSYFKPEDPSRFAIGKFPVWIWEDEVSYYGFPTFGEPTMKAARDVSNLYMRPEERTFVPSSERLAELTSFLQGTIPNAGSELRTVTCQYAITPDREFVIAPLDDFPDIIVGLGAGHAFKFTPTFGRVLAELAADGDTTDDISRFGIRNH